MANQFKRLIVPVVIGLSLVNGGMAAVEECPFSGIKGNVLMAFSLPSYDEYGVLLGGGNVGEALVVTIRDEVIPSLLQVSGATRTLSNLPGFWDQVAKATHWERLKKTRVTFSVFEGVQHFPKLAVRFTPPQGESGPLYQDISNLFSAIAKSATEVFTWQDLGTNGFLILGATDSVSMSTDEEPIRLFSLSNQDNHVLLESMPDIMLEKGSEPDLCHRESFKALWQRLPQPQISSFYVDFQRVFGFVEATLTGIMDDLASSGAGSSFVLDETNEALFREDPETLDKLRQVERDFSILMPDMNPNPYRKPIMRILALAKAQGQMLNGISMEGRTILSTTLWRPDGDPVGMALFETSPLSQAYLNLFRLDCADISIATLPDLKKIYTTLLDIIREIPEGKTALDEWDKLQKSLGFSFENDLLAAIGHQSAWISTPKQKASFSGLQVVSNDLTVVQEIADIEAARRTLTAVEGILGDFDIPMATKTLDSGSITEMDLMLLGKVSWTIQPESGVFCLTTNASSNWVQDVGTRMKSPALLSPTNHPDWPLFQKIWVDHPTGVRFTDLTTTWKQSIDQLRSTQMMVALMGDKAGMILPFIQIGLKFMTTVKAPESILSVGYNEGGLRIGRTLIVYPAEQTQ